MRVEYFHSFLTNFSSKDLVNVFINFCVVIELSEVLAPYHHEYFHSLQVWKSWLFNVLFLFLLLTFSGYGRPSPAYTKPCKYFYRLF